jgi:UDP-N-acetylmuramoyl-L-alanyl-D-glutamate--2,6-diaminopimelate ligase
MYRIKSLVPQSLKNIYHLFQAILVNFWFGFPSRKIKIIGVTGTNGKTTTVQMIARILEEAGKKVAVASTINFKMNGDEEINKTKFTTLSSFAVQRFIKRAIKSGCEYLVLETSSHSLDQYRVWGVEYDIAVITNITREHLDYHETMEEYRKAKLRLFQKAKTAIVNLDMEKPEDFLKFKTRNKFGYSTKISNQFQNQDVNIIKAESIELGINGSKYEIHNTQYEINLPGEFNIENALAATCVGISEGINLEIIKIALGKIKLVPGRMEYVENKKNINIIIDYALTPDSLEKLYTLIEKINIQKNKVVAVFGSCGERDRGKRPLMGEIVSRYADFMIITNEDPYNEDPWQIINEVVSGIKNKTEGENFWKIFDRREAIKKALQIAKPGDFVIVTGKGAEETMALGKKRIPWNDGNVIREVLSEL